MKRILAMAMSCLCACTAQEPFLSLQFSPADPAAKGIGISDGQEKNIDRWAIVLFNKADAADVFHASASGDAAITCTVKQGSAYMVYAIANYPEYGDDAVDPSAIQNADALKAMTATLSDFSPTALPMFGSLDTGTITEDTSRSLAISRIASRVSLEKLSLDLQDERERSLSFTLKGVYLTNVYCKNTYGNGISYAELSSEAGAWYNAMGYHTSGENVMLDALLADKGINAPLAQGSSYTVCHSFYCMPNPTPAAKDSRSDTWSIRCTRLVIEAQIGTKTYYYPVTLPAMVRNASYRITEAVIRKLGSLSPEEEIPGAITVTLQVQVPDGWENTYNISENS